MRVLDNWIASCLFAALFAMAGHCEVLAEETGPSLQEQSQNPIASLISVPFEVDFNFNAGAFDNTQTVFVTQPVYPLELNSEWNLITRPIIPFVDKPRLFPGDTQEFGLADMQTQFYFVPAATVPTALGDLTWGVGPTFQFPTATDSSLGSEKWAAGPGAVVFFARSPWNYGFLINNIWSFAGDNSRPDVNVMTIQPFINYNIGDGWSVGGGPIITANWEATSGNKWTVPVGGGFDKLFKLGNQPVKGTVKAYYNVVRPDGGPEWQLQLKLTWLFPG